MCIIYRYIPAAILLYIYIGERENCGVLLYVGIYCDGVTLLLREYAARGFFVVEKRNFFYFSLELCF